MYNGQSYRAGVSLAYYNCATQESAIRTAIWYELPEPGGRVVLTISTPVEEMRFAPHGPGTVGEAAMRIVCARFPGKKR
ncbi:MAG: hypothetical protein JWR22_2854 [Herminiimonas sp.]|nr:hypothetical protein [Herminiimonas sp.]